ncbi:MULTISPECIES: DNA mismatch repair endonuclease MutL [Lactobacillus]|uniref:DNA mismatch repair protein MutL n=1 Tax=Lactobacillus xujianguonis TaxID=2495899 RepID=A0A437SUP5_9LACO|nr:MULTISPECIES: DNA mismatch repair endonuclease MutL [Lactobacillus]RVU70537.1 DNA mismatch repair endonuclease MutL [Lactobacillus xujianguonis]RVU77034.1 DNA mismatch repair endonuclease MutL [Lactobacillus xujianguonis]
MAKIHELSENLSNQIAAGEVIERPASVVKELVENSIDAGASRIRVDFVDSGLKQIVVQDNGSGIAKDQIDLAFTRHATSKINNEHDLFNVATLGFRGEALASIAAVAHIEILTNTANGIGSRAVFSGGSKLTQEDGASAQGTKITVKDLFFNTPARLKYLRSPRTEMVKIVDIINRIALGYPQIALTLSNKGKVLLRTPGNGKLPQTVATVYGRHIAEKMVAIKNDDSDFQVAGLISKPELTRSTRNFISILLNGRYIRNFKLATAVMDGYGSKLTAKHYPIAIISIKVDPLLVDVNVHPTKQEVRLSKEKELGRLITSAVSAALIDKGQEIDALANLEQPKDTLVDQLQFNLNKNVVNTKREVEPVPEVHESAPAFSESNTTNHYVDLTKPRSDSRYVITPTWRENVQKQIALTPFNQTKSQTEVISAGDATLANNLPELTFVGQTDLYLLAQSKGDLFLVDQVAARRRLAFERIKKAMNATKITQQGLLTPIVLEFGNLDFLQIKDKLAEFKKIGIYLENFGQDSFIVRSYPTWIKGDTEESLRLILADYLDQAKTDFSHLFNDIAAKQAKKEVSGRIKLSAGEASELLADLRQCLDPYRDAEGHLTLVKLSQTDLRKMFKKDE